MEYLIGIIAVLLGGVFVLRGKKNSAEGIVHNLEALYKDMALKEKQMESEIEANHSKEELEELDNEEQNAKEDASDTTVDDNLDFWNKRKR